MDFNVAVVKRREGICLSHADATHLHFNPIFPKEYVWDIGETSWLQKRPHFPSCFESWDEVLTCWKEKNKLHTKNKGIHIRIIYRTSIKVCPQDVGPIAGRSKLIRRCYIVLWWYFFFLSRSQPRSLCWGSPPLKKSKSSIWEYVIVANIIDLQPSKKLKLLFLITSLLIR